MTYETLPVTECQELTPIFTEYDSVLPKQGFIVVAREGKRIVAFQCCHPVVHAGPVWITPELRGNGMWQELQEASESELKKRGVEAYYQYGTELNEVQLARLGLKPLGWTVWMKELA